MEVLFMEVLEALSSPKVSVDGKREGLTWLSGAGGGAGVCVWGAAGGFMGAVCMYVCVTLRVCNGICARVCVHAGKLV